MVALDLAGRGDEAVQRIFGVDAALDGAASQLDVVLGEAEREPGSDPYLLLHDIDPRDHLRHRVLHLDAGVHFEEVELPVLPEELYRSCSFIAHGAGGVDCHLSHASARCGIQRRGRRFLYELLVPPLNGAFPLAQVDDVPLRVGEDLELDVTRIGQVPLDVDIGDAESVGGDCLRGGERFQQFALVRRDGHPDPSSASGGFDDDGIAYVAGDGFGLPGPGDALVRARHHGDTAFYHLASAQPPCRP